MAEEARGQCAAIAELDPLTLGLLTWPAKLGIGGSASEEVV